MSQQFMLIALGVLIACGSFCIVSGSHHKHIIIHVPYHIKHHHHTHTVFKHIKHIPDHHIHHHDHHIDIHDDDHHHHHDDHHHHHHHDDEYKITSIPSHFDLAGGWSNSDYGSISDVGGSYDGGFDSGSYESNNFGNFGWDDK